MRPHHCLCSACRAKNYKDCAYIPTVGEWKDIPMSMIKVKTVSETVPPLQTSITKFFEGSIQQNMRTMLVGVKMKDSENDSMHLMLAVLVVPPRINTKAPFCEEHTINKRKFLMHVLKGDAVIRVKLLINHPSQEGTSDHNYFLPEKTKPCNISILDIVDPTSLINDSQEINRENYINYRTTEAHFVNKKQAVCKQITYHIEAPDFEWLKSHFEPQSNLLSNS